jgi:Na+-driven multidrug efflux pump
MNARISVCICSPLSGKISLATSEKRTIYWAAFFPPATPSRARQFASILRIGLPSAVSIAMYAGVYLAMFQLVLSRLGRDAIAGLGIGFNAFEGVSFPFFLGVAVAGSSLVGRNLGGGFPDDALRAVKNVRRVGIALGFSFMVLFFVLGPKLVPIFASDPGVVAEATRYVRILAIAQLFVAVEAVNEKILLGSGHSQPIFWISVPGNLLRIPLAWFLALHCGYGPAGVWWAINLTTVLKAGAFFWMVQRGTWLSVGVWK